MVHNYILCSVQCAQCTITGCTVATYTVQHAASTAQRTASTALGRPRDPSIFPMTSFLSSIYSTGFSFKVRYLNFLRVRLVVPQGTFGSPAPLNQVWGVHSWLSAFHFIWTLLSVYFCDPRTNKNKGKPKFHKGTLGRNHGVHLVEPHHKNQ
jgi:hypothetical protein